MDSLRVSELAKDIEKTSKEVLEAFAEIGISVKSHSNTVTPDQIRKLKEHLGILPKNTAPKKAFIPDKNYVPDLSNNADNFYKSEKKYRPPCQQLLLHTAAGI